MFDKPHEECGVFGIYNKNQFNAVHLTYLALYALQHRGQISCGIAINRGGVVDYHRDLGIVPDVFDADALQKLSQDGGPSRSWAAGSWPSAMCAIRPAACQSAKILSPL